MLSMLFSTAPNSATPVPPFAVRKCLGYDLVYAALGLNCGLITLASILCSNLCMYHPYPNSLLDDLHLLAKAHFVTFIASFIFSCTLILFVTFPTILTWLYEIITTGFVGYFILVKEYHIDVFLFSTTVLYWSHSCFSCCCFSCVCPRQILTFFIFIIFFIFHFYD